MEGKIMGGMLIGLLWIGLSGIAAAQHGHGHGPAPAPAAKKVAPQEPAPVMAEGVKVTLEVMSMGDHLKHIPGGAVPGQADRGQSHSLMVQLQDVTSREILSDARISFILTGPSGQKETGRMVWSGDHYGAGVTLKGKGKYEIHLQIEEGGMSRQAKFSYEMK